MHRRRFLAAGGVALGFSTAGCSGLFETETVSTRAPPLVEDRPDAVYIPTHVEGMQVADSSSAGRYQVALSYSFPHRFWLVTGEEPRQVEIREEDSIHMMLSVWDGETGTVLPSSNTPVEVRRDGETVVSKSMWGMLSQNMGVHFGDNVALDGDGTYDVTVDFGPLPTRQLGEFADAFGDAASVDMTLEFDQEALQDVMFQRIEDRQGERDAVAPMEMDMLPSSQLPPPADLPGTLLGTGTSGDAVFAATALESVPNGLDAEGTYLAVSARTPYNRYPIPRMALSASVDGGDPVELESATHSELGFHYGAVLDGLPSGSELTVSVDTPSSVARHEGYETAFLEMDPVTIAV